MKTRLIIFLILASILFGGLAGGYLAIARGIPSIEELRDYRGAPGTKIYADDDTLIGADSVLDLDSLDVLQLNVAITQHFGIHR